MSVRLFALTAVLVVAGCTSRSPHPAPTRTDTWTTFSGRGVSFEHPAAWTSHPLNQQAAPVAYVVTYLSTVPMVSTCTTSAGSVACHAPSPSLLEGGVFVTWSVSQIPQQRLPAVGDDATVAGHAAKVVRGDLRGCQTGAVDAVTATIAEDADGKNLLWVQACFGPGENTATDRADVDRMLASLRITS